VLRAGLAALLVSLALASASAAATPIDAAVVGAEVPPISSTLGTFVGATTGPLGAFRIQIDHRPLATGPTVPITGGTFTMRLRDGRALRSGVTGGAVTVVDRGTGCTNQVYAVRVTLAIGSFDGTLTHRRRELFGRCVIYAATIGGRATLSA
jgi:hypothetical protein